MAELRGVGRSEVSRWLHCHGAGRTHPCLEQAVTGRVLVPPSARPQRFPEDFRPYLAKGLLLKDQGREGDATRYFIQARWGLSEVPLMRWIAAITAVERLRSLLWACCSPSAPLLYLPLCRPSSTRKAATGKLLKASSRAGSEARHWQTAWQTAEASLGATSQPCTRLTCPAPLALHAHYLISSVL